MTKEIVRVEFDPEISRAIKSIARDLHRFMTPSLTIAMPGQPISLEKPEYDYQDAREIFDEVTLKELRARVQVNSGDGTMMPVSVVLSVFDKMLEEIKNGR